MSDITIVGANGNVAKISSNTDVTATLLKRSVNNKSVSKEDYAELRNNNISHETITEVLKHLSPSSDFEKISSSLKEVNIEFEVKNFVNDLIDNVISSIDKSVVHSAEEIVMSESVSSPIKQQSEIEHIQIEVIDKPKTKIELLNTNDVLKSSYSKTDNPDGKLDINAQKLALTNASIPFIEERALEPAVNYTVSKNLTYTNEKGTPVTLNPNDKCVIRETRVKGKFEILKLNIDSKNKVSIDESSKGLIEQKDFVSLKKESSFIKMPKYGRALFTGGKPKASDIRQGSIGDCYLIASLESIVRKDPSMIYNMIKDNGDQTVTVRLFDVKGSGKNKVFTPKFITFEKSLPSHGNTAIGSGWVQMLEKAYAIEKGSYDHIGKGGQMSDAFETFVGKSAERIELKHTEESNALVRDLFSSADTLYKGYSINENTFNNFISNMRSSNTFTEPEIKKIVDRKDVILEVLKTAPNFDYINMNVSQFAFESDVTKGPKMEELLKSAFQTGDIDKHNQWNTILQNQDFKDFVDQKIKPMLDKTKYDGGGQVRAAEIMESIATHKNESQNFKLLFNSIPEDIMNKFMDSLLDNVPGKRFSGSYSKPQLELFNQIKSKFEAGENLGLGSKTSVGRSVNKAIVGRSAGEEISKGLVGGHAFAITGVKEEKGVKYIQISNPWGDTNRTYNNRKPEKTESPESWIELSDISKRFSSFYTT